MFNARIVAAAAVLALAGSTLAACGSSTASSGGSSGSSSKLSSSAKAALATAYKGVGSDLSDLSSVTPKSGQNLYVISCGEQVASCHVPAAAVQEAAKKVGWSSTIADGKLSPAGFAAAIRQAIAGKATIIVPIGIGCGVAQAAFKEAKAAGITIIGGGGVDDCSPKLWASERLWLKGYTPQQQWEEFGKLQADYLYGKLNGKVKAVTLTETTQTWGAWITDGFNTEIQKLGGTKAVANVDISDQENADGSYVQKVTTALLKQPTANALVVPVDSWLTSGLSAALVQAGLQKKLTVVGRGGDAAALDLIRKGNSGFNATIGFAVQWGAWGSVDTAIRILAGQQAKYIGESMQAVDATHNMPSSGMYTGDIDFKAKFEKAWGK